MKNFLKNVFEWKTWACLVFTGSTIIFMLITWFTGKESISLLHMTSILLISAVGTLLQFIFFTEKIIKKMKYSLRLAFFAVIFLAFLSLCAYIFNWIPINLGSWAIFGGIFLITLVGITVGFEVFFRITGNKYDGLLGQYKKQQENKNH